jgi:hypothetical protein
MARALAAGIERRVVHTSQPFVLPDGRLDMEKLLAAFAEFWREHGEALIGKLAYHEVAPQLVLMAFLQKIVNGGGFIDREYGLGRGRMDLLIRWPHHDAQGPRQWQREAVEIKVWHDKKADPRELGLAQLDGYLDKLGLDHGVLVIFDRRSAAPPHAERIAMSQDTTPAGRPALLLRA